MDSRLEQVLDECIRRIATGGATVEECLARYPVYAAEMEPHLRLAARMSSALSGTPAANAKERTRQRLHAELRSLDARDRARAVRQGRWPPVRAGGWRLPALTGAWRVAAASAAVLVAFIFAGTGIVAASGNSIPGNALYPVKRAAEDARLAVAFSAEAKAHLQLTYAERRSEELASLVDSGEAERIPTAQAALDRKLATVSNALTALPEGTAAQLRERLQDSSTTQLARLQEALRDAPASSKEVASVSFQQASASYGDAVEAALVKAPVTYVFAQPGTIQLRVTDPPPPGVEKAIVWIEQVEAHLVAGGESRWAPLFVAPQSFDLLQVADVQRLLGQVQVAPGTYTRLRFLVSSATVVVNGVEHPVKVPSERMSFTRPFVVEEGKTTVVLLDFDGAKSLKVSGQGQYAMTPVVRVLAHRAESTLAAEKLDSEKERPAAPGQEKVTPKPTPSGKETPSEVRLLAQVEIEGPVQSLSQRELVVRGQPIQIPEGKVQQGDVKQSQRVVVVAQEQPDGSLVAVEVRESPRDKEKSGKDTPASKDEPQPEAVEVKGVLRAIEGDAWLVGDRRLHVGPDTKVSGTPAIGARVVAKGLPRSDGGVDAQAVQIVPAPAEATPTPVGGDRRPPATPTPKKDQNKPDQGNRATPTQKRRSTPTPERKVTPTPKLETPAPPQFVRPTPTPRPNEDNRGPSATPTPKGEESKATPTPALPSNIRDKLPLPTLTVPGARDNPGQGNR
ncbi:MAG: DUF4382 domain-containing protein [Chloroflexota bacterium]|nr:DUF4382 domain-containing protein [Chloroflexota bacterium]